MSTDHSSPHVFDVTQANFETEVIHASLNTPVLVDFWAPWCEPCKTLGPLLEKLALQYQGAFRLAKVDVDQHRELAGMFGIRSVPTVVLLLNGEIADGFSGALSEGQLREFLDKHITSAPPADDTVDTDLAHEESPSQQLQRLQAELAAEPERTDLKLDLAETMLKAGQPAGLAAVLASLPADVAEDARVLRLQTALNLSQQLSDSPSDEALAAQLAQNPQDWAALDQQALRQFFHAQPEAALQQWLQLLQHARDWQDGLARQRLLSAFGSLDDVDLVGRYRRRMASLLF